MSNKKIPSEFKYKGWFCGVVPVYIGGVSESDDPLYCEPMLMCRFKWLEWWMDIVEFTVLTIARYKTSNNPDYIPMFKIKVTGEI